MEWHKWNDGSWKDHPEDACTGQLLFAAARRGDEERVLQLLAQGADVMYKTGGRFSTALHQACLCALSDAYVRIGEALLAHNAAIDATDSWGYTPLMACAWVGAGAEVYQTKLAKVLLDHGADRDWVDIDGDTVLAHARCNNLHAFVQLLQDNNNNNNDEELA